MANEATPHGGEPSTGGSPPGREQGPDYAMLSGESGERFVAPAGFAGYALRDPLGREIGKIEKLFVNGRGEPEYVVVKIGFFRRKTVLIPVEAVSVDDEQRALVLR